MEVFKAPITTKLDSDPMPSAGRATRGKPVAIVPRKAQTNAIRLGLVASLPRSSWRVVHMLRARREIDGGQCGSAPWEGDAWVRISRFRRPWTAYYAGVARVLVS